MDAALRSLLDWYAAVGVDVPDVPPPAPVRAKRPVPSAKPTTPAKPVAAKEVAPAQPAPDLTKIKTLDALREAMNAFDAGPLGDGAKQVVFSRGNPEADIMVIGEAPGRDEDMHGKPFIGRAGQLLDRMLGAIALGPEDVYITNVVNWRPPSNRKPTPAEIEMCLPFLHRHIELAQPKLLLLVGGISMTAMTGQTGIMKNHGQWSDVMIGGQSYPAMPLYHPAFLLRRPELKKEAWRDLLSLRARILAL